jgi:hypothetical protein
MSVAFKWPLLGFLALILAIGLPVRFRQARRCSFLRSELPTLPARIEDLSEMEERCLFRATREVLPHTKPTPCARHLRQIHDEILVRPPSMGATAGLLLTYAASFLLGMVVLVLVAGGLPDEEELAAARELATHLERFEQESQPIIEALDKVRAQPAESADTKAHREEERRLRRELGRKVDEALKRIEEADPFIRDLVFESEEDAREMMESLQEMRDELREPEASK